MPARRANDVALSGSIRGVLHARLDRLDPEERAVLERASVLGRSFSLDSVLQLIPADEQEQAHGRVFGLVRRGLDPPRRDRARPTGSASSTR